MDQFKLDLSGVKIDSIVIKDIYDAVDSTIKHNINIFTIGYINLHGFYLALTDSTMSDFYKKVNINYIDGMYIIWLLKIKGLSINYSNRITFFEFVYDFFAHCKNRNYKILWIGAEADILRKGINVIKSKVPGLQIYGIDGYKKDSEYLAAIEEIKPNIIILGMGMPRQELWMLNNSQKVGSKVIWCVGATMDFIAGNAYVSPQWAGKFGLDWLFRLFNDPKRMWYRYFIEPILIIWHILIIKKNHY